MCGISFSAAFLEVPPAFPLLLFFFFSSLRGLLAGNNVCRSISPYASHPPGTGRPLGNVNFQKFPGVAVQALSVPIDRGGLGFSISSTLSTFSGHGDSAKWMPTLAHLGAHTCGAHYAPTGLSPDKQRRLQRVATVAGDAPPHAAPEVPFQHVDERLPLGRQEPNRFLMKDHQYVLDGVQVLAARWPPTVFDDAFPPQMRHGWQRRFGNVLAALGDAPDAAGRWRPRRRAREGYTSLGTSHPQGRRHREDDVTLWLAESPGFRPRLALSNTAAGHGWFWSEMGSWRLSFGAIERGERGG